MRFSISLILFTFCLIASCRSSKTNQGITIDPYHYESRKKIIVENAAVVSAHPLASKVGAEILKKGGTAVDAAIATQLALSVVYPKAGNLGGGGFTVARLRDGRVISIDYREMAPGKAHRDMYLDENGNPLIEKSQLGHLASGVPGSVAGIFSFHQYASIPLSVLIQPAIELAEKGFIITEREASGLNGIQDELRLFNTQPSAFLKPGGWNAGDTLIQADLAKTLRRIRDHGLKEFYEGETARLIAEEMKRGNGLINQDDLKAYKAISRTPHVFEYKNYKIFGMPMPSSGGVLVNQMMKMIEKKDIAKMGFHSLQAIQLMTEVEKRAFADRGEYMGDADFYNVPVKELTSEAYLEKRMSDFVPLTSNNPIQHGDIRPESEETTHLSVMDKNGNAVAITTTLNDSYGSRVVVGGAGFFMNDEMDDFSIKAGVPNMYGAIGGEANAIVPRKRMLSSMSPTIVIKDDFPFMVVGTPGGTTIPTSVFQTLVNVLEFGLSPDHSVNAPKFHHQWFPDSLYIENTFSPELINGMKQMGYNTRLRSAIGRTELIVAKKLDGKLVMEAVADNRGDDSAEGY